jgi:hypothetical protein
MKIVCEDCGNEHDHDGPRRVKRCPPCRAAARRQQDRDRKNAYRPCWQCGRSRPLTFDRDGPVDHDFEVPACFCGLTCWLLWWDNYSLEELERWFREGQEGAPRVKYPQAYQKIRGYRDAGNPLPDYRGDPGPASGGSPEENELLYADMSFL